MKNLLCILTMSLLFICCSTDENESDNFTNGLVFVEDYQQTISIWENNEVVSVSFTRENQNVPFTFSGIENTNRADGTPVTVGVFQLGQGSNWSLEAFSNQINSLALQNVDMVGWRSSGSGFPIANGEVPDQRLGFIVEDEIGGIPC